MTVIENRKLVAFLIFQVLVGKMSVREATVKFPDDRSDKSISSAFHALIHFEADEDLRASDPLYREEQDDYLEFIANTLNRGDDLPDNVINNYDKYYKEAEIPHSKNTKGFWKSFFRFLNI